MSHEEVKLEAWQAAVSSKLDCCTEPTLKASCVSFYSMNIIQNSSIDLFKAFEFNSQMNGCQVIKEKMFHFSFTYLPKATNRTVLLIHLRHLNS